MLYSLICGSCTSVPEFAGWLPCLPFGSSGMLHCLPHGKPACHLLTVPRRLGARKGLPVRTGVHPGGASSGIISCQLLFLFPGNLYFKHFFRAFTEVCTCSCWAHTKYKRHKNDRLYWYVMRIWNSLKDSHESKIINNSVFSYLFRRMQS